MSSFKIILIFSFQVVHSMDLKKKQFAAVTLVETVIRKLAILYTHVLIHNMYGKKERKALNPGKIASIPTAKNLKKLFAIQI